MDLTRQLSRNEYRQIKDATKRLIKRCGGLQKAADITRLCKSRLSDCQNVSDLSSFLPVDVVADLESHVGESIVSQLLAEFAVDGCEPHRPMDRLHRMQAIIKEASEAAVEIGNGDTQAAVKEIDEAIEVLEQARRDIVTRQNRPRVVPTMKAAQ